MGGWLKRVGENLKNKIWRRMRGAHVFRGYQIIHCLERYPACTLSKKLRNLRIIKIGNQIRNVKFGYQFLPLSLPFIFPLSLPSSLPSISFHFLPIPFFVKPKQYRALHYGKAVQC